MSQSQVLKVATSIAMTHLPLKASGEVTLLSWTPSERRVRALKTLLKFWVGSMISVIFPLVHFILVPGLFIAGPVVAYFILQQEQVVTSGHTECPKCQAQVMIKKAHYKGKITEVCRKCYSELEIRVLTD